jgi:predicted RNase H-like HicB family nuclease
MAWQGLTLPWRLWNPVFQVFAQYTIHVSLHGMNLTFETEREDDGRWIAEVPELAGVMAYGATELEAIGRAEALALRVLAERIEHGEARPMDVRIIVAAA